jgi:hypothetical protein
MYIPLEIRSSSAQSASLADAEIHAPRHALGASDPRLFDQRVLQALATAVSNGIHRAIESIRQMWHTHITSASGVKRRAATSSSNDTTIGIVVGVLLGVFFVGLFIFLYVYRKSVRFASKKRRRRKGTGSSKSSKASSDGGGAAPAPPPPAPAAPAAA